MYYVSLIAGVMDLLHAFGPSLLSPMVLAFGLGLVATLLRSELKIPESLTAALTIYLLLAIGLGVVGAQTALGGFLLAVIAGHEARFAKCDPETARFTALLAGAGA